MRSMRIEHFYASRGYSIFYGVLGLQPFCGTYMAWDTLHVISLAVSMMLSSAIFFTCSASSIYPSLSL